jgi:DNA invertase Pin-like site-specific DNA recombinase
VSVLRAWLYARVSTRKRSQDESPERQLDQCRTYAAAQGWRVVGEGIDRVSGKRFSRPDWDRMRGELGAGRIDRLVVVDLDRLGRGSLVTMLQEVELIHAAGARLVVLRFGGQALDLGSAVGAAAFQTFAVFGEFQRALGREKVLDGLDFARRSGKRLGRPPRVAPHVVEHARALRANSRSWGEVGAELFRQGFGRYAPQSLRTAVLRADAKGDPKSTPQSGEIAGPPSSEIVTA